MPNDWVSGGCHCGAVRFEVQPPLRDVIACHCTQCRKVSGHYWAASSVPHAQFRLIEDAGLRWYRSSPLALRGFCGQCSATLFWQPEGEPVLSFSVAALDGPSGVTIREHIFTEDGGDYYDGRPAGETGARLRGSCLCGACAFSVPAPAGDITACHCDQCRKTSGHYAASFAVAEAALVWDAREKLAEYATAGGGRRGFCTGCGSSLWVRDAAGAFAVAAGAVDGATGGRLVAHGFAGQRGDYYDLDDGLPRFDGAAPVCGA